MAILETLGYECHTEEDEIVVKRNGVVQEKLKAALVESKCRAGDRVYCIDFANHAIVDMNAYGFDVSRFIPMHERKPEQRQTSQFERRLPTGAGRALDNVAMQRGGSGDSNREWGAAVGEKTMGEG